MAEIKNIRLHELELNEGQMYGLPKNPRWIRDARYDALKKSIEDAPEMLGLRELLVYPLDDVEGHEGKYIIIGGNQRYRACLELGYQEVPCKVIPLETPVKKLREYVIKDNEAFGQNDWDALANDWNLEELGDFGMELDYLANGNGDNWDNMEEPEDDKQEDTTETKYSTRIEAPIYEITGDKPSVGECYQDGKVKEMIARIDASGVSEEEKAMLRVCAYRFAPIRFDKMAEYYAHSNAEMQELMEESALVVIDFDKAVENGFVEMTEKMFSLTHSSATPEEIESADYDEE